MAVERRKPEPLDVVVQDVVMESTDTVTLVLDTDRPVEYRAGQFLTIDPRQFPALHAQQSFLEDLKGKKELTRAYSMSSAPHEPLAITIKIEPYFPKVSRHAPLLSPSLVHATPKGTRLHVVGFTGPYTLPLDIEERTDHVLHVVAGSGAVPNFSILKDSLNRHAKLRHTFVSSNKTWADALFREKLEALARAYPSRLHLVHTLTRQADITGLGEQVRQGRVGHALLEELCSDAQTAFAYVCGPAITAWERRAALESKTTPEPRFLENTLQFLHGLGFTNDRIKREAYG